MQLLIQFLLRLCFGLTAGMAITSSRQVTSGYFRNHMYVTLGLATLAAMVSFTIAPPEVFWFGLITALASYVGSVFWLYERPFAGKVMLFITAWTSLTALFCLAEPSDVFETVSLSELKKPLSPWAAIFVGFLISISIVTSGLLLGMTMAAMLLGHWYLNTPTMELAPLRRLILAMGVAIVLQMIVSAIGLWGELEYARDISTQWWLFLLLRWSFGLFGVGVLAWMAWQTLKIPNTQSATGILYVAVIGTFVGETMAMLLSAQSLFPL